MLHCLDRFLDVSSSTPTARRSPSPYFFIISSSSAASCSAKSLSLSAPSTTISIPPPPSRSNSIIVPPSTPTSGSNAVLSTSFGFGGRAFHPFHSLNDWESPKRMEHNHPGRKMDASIVPQEAESRLEKVMRVHKQMINMREMKIDIVTQDCVAVEPESARVRSGGKRERDPRFSALSRPSAV